MMTDKTSSTLNGEPNEHGFLSVDAEASIVRKPTIKIFDANDNLIYEADLEVYQYQATALAHDSGFLTLERYFIIENNMEGYTYPYAEVPGHQTNLKTNVVSVTHPDTGESISVAPYPWTEAELDDAPW